MCFHACNHRIDLRGVNSSFLHKETPSSGLRALYFSSRFNAIEFGQFGSYSQIIDKQIFTRTEDRQVTPISLLPIFLLPSRQHWSFVVFPLLFLHVEQYLS